MRVIQLCISLSMDLQVLGFRVFHTWNKAEHEPFAGYCRFKVGFKGFHVRLGEGSVWGWCMYVRLSSVCKLWRLGISWANGE